jgi:hypothetical protein
MSPIVPPLMQRDGYGIVTGFGVLFALGMVATTMSLRRYHGELAESSETFTTADRKVRTGFSRLSLWNIGCVLVCKWSDSTNSFILFCRD